MNMPRTPYKENHGVFPKTYYYIDDKVCQRERCKRSIIIVLDFIGFANDVGIIILVNIHSQAEYVLELPPLIDNYKVNSNIEFVNAMYEEINQSDLFGKHNSKPHIITGAMPDFWYNDSVISGAGYFLVDENYITMPDEMPNIPDVCISIQNKPYFCSRLAAEIGYCQDKTGQSHGFCNIISRYMLQSYHYPAVPIMGHNCKQCGVCLIACKHRNAIKNSLVNRTVETDEIVGQADDSLKYFTSRNQRAIRGEYLEQ